VASTYTLLIHYTDLNYFLFACITVDSKKNIQQYWWKNDKGVRGIKYKSFLGQQGVLEYDIVGICWIIRDFFTQFPSKKNILSTCFFFAIDS